ncbi:MAG: hypothetical protein GX181_07215 [Synergistaceae bacterium]|nr:hypothetical protein [Synergistaceae bacterium]
MMRFSINEKMTGRGSISKSTAGMAAPAAIPVIVTVSPKCDPTTTLGSLVVQFTFRDNGYSTVKVLRMLRV